MYNWLTSHIDVVNLINCGSSGLCLKKIVRMKSTQSICFLKFDETTLGNMCLYILCRTQGRDLFEYMFRDGSNVAVSLFRSIAIEAAGILYAELRSAAFNLRRDKVWKSLLTPSSGMTDRVLELLQICKVTPLHEKFSDFHRFVSLQNNTRLFDPMTLFDYLSKDPAFLLTWQTVGSDGITHQHLYYVHTNDVYIMLSTTSKGLQCHFDLIERVTNDDTDQRLHRTVGMIINSLLYFLWSETGIGSNVILPN